jgi:citrate lyase subunit gamma (acyl carrier protein)
LNERGELRMDIIQVGMAGTLESSDAAVTIEPGAAGIELAIECADKRFSRHVEAAAMSALAEAGVTAARVSVRDRSALDCTIRARVLAACHRASGMVTA